MLIFNVFLVCTSCVWQKDFFAAVSGWNEGSTYQIHSSSVFCVCVYPAMRQRVSVENSLRNSLIIALIKNFWHFTCLRLHTPLYSHTCSLRVDYIIFACKSVWGLKDTENPWLRWCCPFLISATGDVLNIQDLIHLFHKASWSVTLETTAQTLEVHRI